MRTFKRSTQLFVTLFILAIYLILMLALELIISGAISSFGDTSPLVLVFLQLISYIALAIVMFEMPPDFNYTIISFNDFIIFEMSKDDHRRINKPFTLSKDLNYLVLKDGFSRIRIGYNKQVLAFLKEIRD